MDFFRGEDNFQDECERLLVGIVHFQKFLTCLHPLLAILSVQFSGYPPGRYF